MSVTTDGTAACAGCEVEMKNEIHAHRGWSAETLPAGWIVAGDGFKRTVDFCSLSCFEKWADSRSGVK